MTSRPTSSFTSMQIEDSSDRMFKPIHQVSRNLKLVNLSFDPSAAKNESVNGLLRGNTVFASVNCEDNFCCTVNRHSSRLQRRQRYLTEMQFVFLSEVMMQKAW